VPPVSLPDRFPLLHAPQRWAWGGMDATFAAEPPADELVTNIHVVGFSGGQIVLCRAERERWFLPGGTREEGETIRDCVARELREEAGARLAGPLRWVGAHRCVSDRAVPYRPWQPHPLKAWLWCTADVVIDSAPTCPADGEQVVEVRAVDPAEAQRLLSAGSGWYAELIELAAETR
jgi:8-oxo-dGTP diphosphatase